MALCILALHATGFASTPRPSNQPITFVEELKRSEYAPSHQLGVDPDGSQRRANIPKGGVGENAFALGPKLASEYVSYPPGFGEPDFYHGVASGSPLSDAVVVWTRFTPQSAAAVVPVTLRMAKRGVAELGADTEITFTANAEAANDWVIKIDVRGLEPGTDYVYAFTAAGKASQVGITRHVALSNLIRSSTCSA
eukprot:6171832-Pleurochrysis_carterae.AAC.1